MWMFVYLLSLPIWNFVLPTYAFWKFDDFSWGDTRKTDGEKVKKAGIEYEGEFDSSKITMKRWNEYEQGEFARSNFITRRYANFAISRTKNEGSTSHFGWKLAATAWLV
jgi:hypothetical protein